MVTYIQMVKHIQKKVIQMKKSQQQLKEVELNEAQFNASSIELGTFSDKNLSEVINAKWLYEVATTKSS